MEIAVSLPSAVDKVRPSFVYSTIVKCDSAPCLYVSNYAYVWCNMTVLQHSSLSVLSGAPLHFSELHMVAVYL